MAHSQHQNKLLSDVKESSAVSNINRNNPHHL
jgi:hypothetical protein